MVVDILGEIAMKTQLFRACGVSAFLLLLKCGGKSADMELIDPSGAAGVPSSSANKGSGGGPSGGSSGGSVTSGGTATSSTVGGFGGTTTTTSAAATGGSHIPPAPACTKTLNLLGGDLGPGDNWIGGDPTSAVDNPCGVQGLIYKMGDAGLDRIPGTADDTCPYLDKSVSPCSAGHCCVSGRTHRWLTDSSGRQIFDETLWGCGIGISLNDPKDGNGTLPYAGPAQGFEVILSGTLNGQVLRLSYTQTAATSVSPFKQVTYTGDWQLAFSDVYCPTWGSATDCVEAGAHPHALQVWAVGGDVEGDFELCIDGVYPML
jgi:hypothetical protein